MLNLFKKKKGQAIPVPSLKEIEDWQKTTNQVEEKLYSFEDWCEEFKVSSAYSRDTLLQEEIKLLVIKSAHKYNRLNQNKIML